MCLMGDGVARRRIDPPDGDRFHPPALTCRARFNGRPGGSTLHVWLIGRCIECKLVNAATILLTDRRTKRRHHIDPID